MDVVEQRHQFKHKQTQDVGKLRRKSIDGNLDGWGSDGRALRAAVVAMSVANELAVHVRAVEGV